MALIQSSDGTMMANEFERNGMPTFGLSALYDECLVSGETPEVKTSAELAAELSVHNLVVISPDPNS